MNTPVLKTRLRERLGYGLGDLGSGMVMFSTVSLLMPFYTDNAGLAASAVGALLFGVRVWDAVWDVVVGLLADRTRTRWGRCRPYLLGGGVMLALAWVATFQIELVKGSLFAAGVTYTMLMMAFSLINIPYSALPALMTSDPGERMKLQAWRGFFGSSAPMVISASMLPLVAILGGGDQALGYSKAVVVMAGIVLTMHVLCFAVTKERDDSIRAEQAESRSVGPDLWALVHARAWWFLLVLTSLVLCSIMIPIGSAVYYYQHVVGDPGAVGGFFGASGFGGLVGALLSVRLASRWCKQRVATVALIVAALSWLSFYFIPGQIKHLGWALAFLSAVAGYVTAPILWSTVNETADHVELESGQQIAGLVAATFSFAAKVAMGGASLVVGGMLGWVGYSAAAVATPEVKQMIVLLMSVMPAAGFALAAAAFSRAPFSAKQTAEVVAALSARRDVALTGRRSKRT